MTSAFVDGAQLMGAVLGVPDVAFAVIQHPIASAGAEGLAERARVAVSEAVAIWTGESGTG